MVSQSMKTILLFTIGIILCLLCIDVYAAAVASGVGIQVVAKQVKSNFGAIAQLITAASYVAGMGFGVGAIVKFKAHKDNPTQVAISVPIVYLIVAVALLYIPTVFKSTGETLFGTSGKVATISGTAVFVSK